MYAFGHICLNLVNVNLVNVIDFSVQIRYNINQWIKSTK